MADPLITLTTDFGEDSPYVAAMKGVILTTCPAARLLDLSHLIPPQDLRHAAHFLASSLPYFPPGTLHVVVVDPGVGSDRAILYVEVNGQRLLVPDNGCWTTLPGADTPTLVRSLANAALWRPTVSPTFHGRDIIAPVAGRLASGLAAAEVGPEVADWHRLNLPQLERRRNGLVGEVVFVDRFGNLITNIAADEIDQRPRRFAVGRKRFQARGRLVATYAEAKDGRIVMLISSAGMMEVAQVNGNAARRLKAKIGTPVSVIWKR